MAVREPRGMSRRGLLGGLGAAGAAAGLASCGFGQDGGGSGSVQVPFRGAHQAGIATSLQEHLAFGAFDVTTSSRADLVAMLREWTAAAENMTAGKPIPGGAVGPPLVPPADTGEALDLPASRLTMTVGFGPGLFDDRFGLAHRKPAELAELPPLPGENLEKGISGGDIGVQACAENPQVAFHALHDITKIARGTAVLRWSQQGFGRASLTGGEGQTPRNLLGFKDGTRNIRGDDTAAMNRHVWIGDEAGQPWLRGGSYLITRRIRMLFESWNRDHLRDQEEVFGRYKKSGAPLSGDSEFDTPDFTARRGDGSHVIPDDAHIRLAARETNGGIQILRRAYNYTSGVDLSTGELDAGLFFVCYQRSPAQFATLQRKLGSASGLGEYIQHVSSAVFACPPGLGEGEWWGQRLLS